MPVWLSTYLFSLSNATHVCCHVPINTISRVADYGYTKLKDLFEALPQVVQIMGEGSRALITLAHRAQVA